MTGCDLDEMVLYKHSVIIIKVRKNNMMRWHSTLNVNAFFKRVIALNFLRF